MALTEGEVGSVLSLMRLAHLSLCLCLLLPLTFSHAEQQSPPSERNEPNLPPDEESESRREASTGTVEQMVSSASESREDRANTPWTVLLNYAYFDSWVPSKIGAAVAYNEKASNSYELQYDYGAVGFDYFRVSIGRVNDQRLALMWRRFGRSNSFNFQLGVHHSSYRVRLGSSLLRTLNATSTGPVDILEVTAFGPSFGLGNRWQTRGGFVWSFDWLVIHVPVLTMKRHVPFLNTSTDPSARSQVEDIVRLMERFPTGAAVRVQLGYAF